MAVPQDELEMTLPERTEVLITAIWLAVSAFNLILTLFDSRGKADIIPICGTNLCGYLISLGLSITTKRLMHSGLRARRFALVGLVFLGGLIVWVVDGEIQYWARHSFHTFAPISALLVVRYNLVYFILIFAFETVAIAALVWQRQLVAKQRDLAAVTIREQKARLDALKLQLNPHFLFNALNALGALVGEERPAEAQEMIARISTFLRNSLAPVHVDGEHLALDEELETVLAYLAIESVRFGDRLDVRFECDEGLSAALVPAYVLQPLVENAIKHAVAPSTQDIKIIVAAAASAGRLILSVEDTGTTSPSCASSDGHGIGLSNTAARLKALHGAEARLETSRTQGGFKASIVVPLRFSKRAIS